jgi:hypothetical protein
MADLLQTLITDLNLDQNQVASVKQAFQSFREQRKNIKDSGGDRSQIQQLRTQNDAANDECLQRSAKTNIYRKCSKI